MIDIHCHILPDFDDGAADLTESLGMARAALSCGVTALVATPHFPGQPESLDTIPRLLAQYQLLREALHREKIDLPVYLGAEVLCLPQTVRMARQKRLPTLGDTDYVLCEFNFHETPVYMNKLLSGIASGGYRIVVAHPERYQAVQKDPAVAGEWFRRGHVLQINKDSLLGDFGPRVAQTAQALLERGLVHIIASDAHSTLYRTTDISTLLPWLRAHCPADYSRILLEENPRRVLKNLPMVPV